MKKTITQRIKETGQKAIVGGLATLAGLGTINIGGCGEYQVYRPRPEICWSEHRHPRPGLYTGTSATDRDRDEITDLDEIQDLGKLAFKTKEEIYLLGVPGRRGSIRIEVINEATGKTVIKGEGEATSPESQIYASFSIERFFYGMPEMNRYNAVLLLNGKEVNRATVNIIQP